MNEQEFTNALPKLIGFAKAHAARIPSDAVVDHEDMVQEALLAVWAKRNDFDPHGLGAFATFSYNRLRWGALKGKSRGDWRKTRPGEKKPERQQVELFEDEVNIPAKDDETLTEILLSMDIVNLNPQEKRAVTLYLAGFSVNEISRLMAVHKTTVWYYINGGGKKILAGTRSEVGKNE